MPRRRRLSSWRRADERGRSNVELLGMMPPPSGPGQPNPWLQLVPLVFFFVVIYFLLIRPARNRQKAVQKMLEALKPGDRVVTSGGIIGTIAAVDRDIVQLRIADKLKVDITRSSVVGLHDQPSPPGSET
jgi:preprotein translocase subunit YajC